MKAPLVSIIMPTYNSSDYIIDSIQSVIEQTYTNWELLITDDCSTDDTVEIIESIASYEHRVKLYKSEINLGAGESRNNSISEARGKYIAFLDSDDIWLPEKLTKQVEFASSNNYLLTFSGYKKFSEHGIGGEVEIPSYTTFRRLLKSNVIGCLTAMYDAEVLGKIYMPKIRKRQDHALWLRILKKVDKAYGLQEPLALYRVGSGMSRNKFKILKWQWKLYREELNLSFLKSAYVFIHYVLKGYLKYLK